MENTLSSGCARWFRVWGGRLDVFHQLKMLQFNWCFRPPFWSYIMAFNKDNTKDVFTGTLVLHTAALVRQKWSEKNREPVWPHEKVGTYCLLPILGWWSDKPCRAPEEKRHKPPVPGAGWMNTCAGRVKGTLLGPGAVSPPLLPGQPRGRVPLTRRGSRSPRRLPESPPHPENSLQQQTQLAHFIVRMIFFCLASQAMSWEVSCSHARQSGVS